MHENSHRSQDVGNNMSIFYLVTWSGKNLSQQLRPTPSYVEIVMVERVRELDYATFSIHAELLASSFLRS